MNGLSNVVDFGEKITAISTKQGEIDEKPNKRGKNTSEKMKTERFHFPTHRNLKGVQGSKKNRPTTWNKDFFNGTIIM